MDLEFLYKVKKACGAMHDVPELQRVEPRLNDDIFKSAPTSTSAAKL